MGSSFEVKGLNEINSRLKELGAKASRAENKAVKAGAEPLAEAMRQNVNLSNKKHKHIREDIQISGIKSKGEKHVDVGPGKNTAYRAYWLENGTVNMPPHPFIDQSAQESKSEVKKAIINTLKRELKI